MSASPPEPERARQEMVAVQLKQRGITQVDVLRALQEVPRERFIAQPLVDNAYADRALPIECGQTISQPYIVALMSQALQLTGQEHVLEIGTGSGYQTAILSRLARRVTSLERHAPLSRRAAQVLDELGGTNITLVINDGTLGYPQAAPYDRIIVTAAAQEVPPHLWEQLGEGGILVIPVGTSKEQDLLKIQKLNGQQTVTPLCKCRFVPLVGDEEDEARG